MKTDIREQLNAASFSLIYFWSTSWENEANTERNVCAVAKGGASGSKCASRGSSRWYLKLWAGVWKTVNSRRISVTLFQTGRTEGGPGLYSQTIGVVRLCRVPGSQPLGFASSRQGQL